MELLFLFLVSLLASALITGLVRRLSQRTRLVDVPGARSAHHRPAPTGGGLGIVTPFGLVCCYCLQSGLIHTDQFLALAGGLFVALTGLADDRSQLALRWRLPAQFAAALWSLFWLGSLPEISLGGLLELSGPLLAFLAFLALVWLLNLYNFMDGIDGLAGTEVVFVTLLSSLLVIRTDSIVLTLSVSLLAASLGFLIWNWPPARIFMGDVGSGFLGFTLGILALLSMQSGGLTVWTWFILLNVFIVDATVTLLRRILAGERWYEGHDRHAYQQAARHFGSHRLVTIAILTINCFWLAPLAWAATVWPVAGMYLSLLATAPLLFLVLKIQAGRPAAG